MFSTAPYAPEHVVVGLLHVDNEAHMCALGVLAEDTLFLSSYAGFLKLNLSRVLCQVKPDGGDVWQQQQHRQHRLLHQQLDPPLPGGKTRWAKESLGIIWSTMIIILLHEYWFIYNLSCPNLQPRAA